METIKKDVKHIYIPAGVSKELKGKTIEKNILS